MRFALLCYNSEAMIGRLSKSAEEAMMARLRLAEGRIRERARILSSLCFMPTTTATYVKAGERPLVLDGPYNQTKEQLLGLWIIDCDRLSDAIEAGQELAREPDLGAIEIRPLRASGGGD